MYKRHHVNIEVEVFAEMSQVFLVVGTSKVRTRSVLSPVTDKQMAVGRERAFCGPHNPAANNTGLRRVARGAPIEGSAILVS